MDLFATPDPDALLTCKPFVGRSFVLAVDEAAEQSPTFASDIVFMRRLGIRPVIVHDAAARSTGARLAGRINRIGGEAVELNGTSAATLMLAISDDGAIELRSVNPALVCLLLERGYIPVLASEGAGVSGVPAPLPMDEAARGLGAAIGAIRLLFNAQPGGIPSDSEGIIPELTSSEALSLAQSGELPAELSHRLTSAALGVRAGVEAAQILDLCASHAALVELLTARHLGTQVVSSVALPPR
jgi:acetylglutamate kinase